MGWGLRCLASHAQRPSGRGDRKRSGVPAVSRGSLSHGTFLTVYLLGPVTPAPTLLRIRACSGEDQGSESKKKRSRTPILFPCPSLTFLPSSRSLNFELFCQRRGGEGGREGRAQPPGALTPRVSPPGPQEPACEPEALRWRPLSTNPQLCKAGGWPSLLRACPSPPPLETQQSQKTA